MTLSAATSALIVRRPRDGGQSMMVQPLVVGSGERRLEPALALLDPDQLDLGADQVDVGWQELEMGEGGRLECALPRGSEPSKT